MRKLVIIPTYNEKENISAMISKVFSLPIRCNLPAGEVKEEDGRHPGSVESDKN